MTSPRSSKLGSSSLVSRVAFAAGGPAKPRSSFRRGPARACDLISAKQAVAAALSLRGLSQEVRAERVATEWQELVGAKIASRTRPKGVYGRMLVIEVASSAWLHELTMLRPTLLGELVTRLGEPRLFDDLSFRIAGRSQPPREAPRRNSRAQPFEATARIPATGVARERIVRDAEAVDDAELRALITRIRIDNDR